MHRMYELFHFQTLGKDHKNYNLLWQTGSQSKQVPPTFKATNSCPPTTLPKTPRAALGPRHSRPATATEQPAGLLCRCLKAKELRTRDSGRLRNNYTQRERGGEGAEDRQRDPTRLFIYLIHLRVDPSLALVSRLAAPATWPARAELKVLGNMHYE